MQTSVEWLIEKLIDYKYLTKDAGHYFEQAKETLYTEEQVREAIEMARSRKGYVSYEYTEYEIIQSLKQTK